MRLRGHVFLCLLPPFLRLICCGFVSQAEIEFYIDHLDHEGWHLFYLHGLLTTIRRRDTAVFLLEPRKRNKQRQ